jgi:hypothetical protein
MGKLFLGPFYRICVFEFTIFYDSLIIKAYFGSDFEFSIIKSIFSTIVLFVWLNHCFAVVWAGLTLFYIMSLYLKYNFRQLKDLMKQNLRSRNTVLLMDTIHKRNYYSELTLEYNKLFKYVLAIIYFLITPIINTVVYITISEVNSLMRLFLFSI